MTRADSIATDTAAGPRVFMDSLYAAFTLSERRAWERYTRPIRSDQHGMIVEDIHQFFERHGDGNGQVTRPSGPHAAAGDHRIGGRSDGGDGQKPARRGAVRRPHQNQVDGGGAVPKASNAVRLSPRAPRQLELFG